MQRLQYARLLFSQNAFASAREQFRAIARLDPQNAEHAHRSRPMSQQIEDWARCRSAAQTCAGIGSSDANAVRYSLGTVAAAQQKHDMAIERFRQVGTGEYFVNAQLRIANALVKRDGLCSGRKFRARRQRADFDDDPATKLSWCSPKRSCCDAKPNSEAFDFLTAAVAQLPDSPDLFYDRNGGGEVEPAGGDEIDLRRAIELKPEHAHALNALGYTFAECNIRLDEAEQLVKR